jgi:hypothetical protein
MNAKVIKIRRNQHDDLPSGLYVEISFTGNPLDDDEEISVSVFLRKTKAELDSLTYNDIERLAIARAVRLCRDGFMNESARS